MTTLVKICGITDEAAVRAAVDAGADAVGFVFFEDSPRNIAPDDAAKLAASVPAHIKTVAVMMHPDPALWDAVRKQFQPQVVQTDSDDFSYLQVESAIEKWPVLREGAVPDDNSLPEVFIYEGSKSGHGQTVNWGIAADLARRGRMVLAGGLNADNVGEAIGQVRPFGVDVSSAVESKPGVKDAGRIRAFVEAAKAAG
jgi:phosphoribosylanthranilate isomerase